MFGPSGQTTQELEGVRMITDKTNARSPKFILPPPGLEDETDWLSTAYSPRSHATRSLESLDEMESGPEEGSEDGGIGKYHQLGQECASIAIEVEKVLKLLTEQPTSSAPVEENADTDILFPSSITFWESKEEIAKSTEENTTFMIHGIPLACTAKQLEDEITRQGLEGAFDFLRVPYDAETGFHMGFGVINLVDPSYAQALRCALFISFPECWTIPAYVQGYQACEMFWGPVGDFANTGFSRRTEPSESSSLQIQQQYHKTKMCAFFMKGKCERGEQCSYAHSSKEVQGNPDLTKTRLCKNFLRQKCFDQNCKYAHGQDDLRSTEAVYKTVLCRWFARGGCKLGSSCRHAHSIEELRQPAHF